MNTQTRNSEESSYTNAETEQRDCLPKDTNPIPALFRVRSFAEKHSDITSESGLRNLINEAKPSKLQSRLDDAEYARSN